MFSAFNCGYVAANAAGIMAKYFATSLAMLKVVSEPRVISICLPMCTTSISLVGLESRSSHLARFFRRLGAGVHRHRDIGLSPAPEHGGCRRRSSPPNGLPPDTDESSCAARPPVSASARKSSTPASAAMAAAVRRLSPVIITVLMPILRSWAKRSLNTAFDDIFQRNNAQHTGTFHHHQRRGAPDAQPDRLFDQHRQGSDRR